MGKTEKIAVLSVLAAVVALFVWSLDRGGEAHASEDEIAGGSEGTEPDANEPVLDRGRLDRPSDRTGGGTEPAPGPGDAAGESAADAGDAASHGAAAVREAGLLSSTVERDAARADGAAGPSPLRLRADWDLVTIEGLAPTLDPHVLSTTAEDGDTWSALAARLYGSAAKAELLRRNNEGVTRPAAGVSLLVPVRDTLGAEAEDREVLVLDGESLWHVSKRVYGKGSRWREIFEANRDKLTDPDRVRPGTVLRVPM